MKVFTVTFGLHVSNILFTFSTIGFPRHSASLTKKKMSEQYNMAYCPNADVHF
uniref:Uncharacterized protein n=1 Tax=Lepeophtheirus salmonis TaxID=72036 RepID=A0A0K2VDL5_LEPSM